MESPESIYNIYCDESCHLLNDKQGVMLLGAVWCPKGDATRLSRELRDIKERHGARGELKWTRVSKSRLNFFHELVEWFFSESPLHFRCLVVQNKGALNHDIFNEGSHDTFYYKMHFSLLNKILSPDSQYRIYLDIKDTRSSMKVQKLKDVLCCDQYDFTGQMIQKIQHVRSHEVELLQLADFLLGAVAYHHRELDTSTAKLDIIRKIEKRLGRSLTRSTPLSESKFNIFVWKPQQV